ncbi:MAG: phage capsid protein [Bacilli bacterium]
MKNKEILNKWKPLLEHESAPAITSMKRQDIVSAILEAQEKDIALNAEGAYTDPFVVSQMKHLGGEMNEAVVTGDHSYNPTQIAQGANSGAAVGIGPTVMGMVRRAIPNMIAFDICGVQPMTAPTGQIFTLRAMYGEDPRALEAREAFHPLAGPNASFSGKTGKPKANNAGIDNWVSIYANGANVDASGDAKKISAGKIKFYNYVDGKTIYFMNASGAEIDLSTLAGTVKDPTEADDALINEKLVSGDLVEISEGMATSYAELMEDFDGSTGNPWNEMSFRIDKQTVEAKSRQLKAQYSIELAQDLKAVHGINADSELSGILATEIMLEINREILLWINATAQVGKTGWTNNHGGQPGVFNFADPMDVRGARWAGESYKALIIQIDKEANEIARQTGRGAGNFIVASRNLVAAFGHTDMFISAAAQGKSTGFETDTNRSVFAGVLAGKYRVYIDQYAKEDYFTVGYKGASEMDAGIYYSPYVALTPLRGADPKNFQPVLGFKTRYAIGINPLADSSKNKGWGSTQIYNGMPTPEMFGKNCYFRRVYVKGL